MCHDEFNCNCSGLHNSLRLVAYFSYITVIMQHHLINFTSSGRERIWATVCFGVYVDVNAHLEGLEFVLHVEGPTAFCLELLPQRL